MIVKLLKYEAEVEWISPRQANCSSMAVFHPEDTISVWFRFKEAVGSILSFAIDIAARDYTKEEFINLITLKGEEELGIILENDEKAKEESLKRDNQREKLNELTAALGDKLDLPYHLKNK